MLLAHVECPGICALQLRHETKKLYIILGQSSIFLNVFLFFILPDMKTKVEAVGSAKKFLPLWRHISPKRTALVSHSEPPTLHP